VKYVVRICATVYAVTCTLINLPQDTTASVGDDVRLNCSTDVLNVPVTWMRVLNESRLLYNHYEVDPSVSSRYHVDTTKPGQFDLVISPVHAEDNAVFICEDNAGFGQQERARLTVVAWRTTEQQDHNKNTAVARTLLSLSTQ